ncbi:EI24 domain-containing protein [Acidovorax sp. SUPP2522]|uniref:EI24 domain-containing protein n=1 Tax=unclassified Acidovorax TaxID=2684926 RepID=UPI00234AE2C1|nr:MULTISPECIES: EI24 domain-containing protein [unclassified Acidovorax]WCM99243.1 EI24 domain-containing protein [Acidovorax sp. GBBC 1281]GKT19141.1 EI24 domain-containing protein [Acidovorax sp. SUPP2522]
MALLIDSFWRAAAYCLHPRVIALSLLPLLLMLLLAWVASHFFWGIAVQAVRSALESSDILAMVWGWFQAWGIEQAPAAIAPLIVVVLSTPVIMIFSVLVVAVIMTPALVTVVAKRRFPLLERKRGASMVASLAWSLGATMAAMAALVVSVPLWLIPPLVLVLPPLIWGWLTYRVMAFDALAEHASRQEREAIFKRHRMRLLTIGILCGYLGAAPGIVWASGVLFAAAFLVLIPLAVWIYTLVFAFSSLWFTHYALDALQQLRAEQTGGIAGGGAGAVPTPILTPIAPANPAP